MFVDTHCHLYKEYYDDIEKIIQNSKNNGINICINAGCDKSTNQEVLSIKNDSIYAVIGYHPEFANDITEEDFSLLEKELNLRDFQTMSIKYENIQNGVKVNNSDVVIWGTIN